MLFLIFLTVLIFFYARFKLVSSKHWARRNVHHLPPIFLFGNSWRAGISESITFIMERFHLENKERKILGFWNYTTPNLLVTDLELVKRVLVRDFHVFHDRRLKEIRTDIEPLAGHLFLLKGKKWKNLRVKLTPTFTSGKMKLMFSTIVDCGKQLEEHLKSVAEPAEVKDLMARFTTDVISSCAFGIESNSLKNPDSEFRTFGRKLFRPGARLALLNVLRNLSVDPIVLKLFKIRIIPKDVSDFFIKAVADTVEYREKNNYVRNDFLQLIIQLMRIGKVQDADGVEDGPGKLNLFTIYPLSGPLCFSRWLFASRYPAGPLMPGNESGETKTVRKFSLEEAAAQCFVFFLAGFETSSSGLTFALYELALNPDIQRKLQEEIDAVASDGLTYEAMCEMEYLDKVVHETLRKYPPVGFLQRVAESDYYIPEIDATIDKGSFVNISVSAIHHDPEYYPEPDRFDPERFSPEEKRKRPQFSFLPFGEGPRNCIGNRFGLMQMKIGLIFVLKQFNVEITKDTQIPIKFDVRGILPSPVGGVQLAFKKRF